MAAAKRITEEAVEIIPTDRPAIILVAAPVDEFCTILITGFLPIAV